MIYGIILILFTLIIYAPSLWVKYVLNKHSREIEGMSGTGGELAHHLVDRFNLTDVTVEMGEEGQDHYDPNKKVISLSPKVYSGKSITAVAVAAHEVGHAIQFVREEPISQLRTKYLNKAFKIKRIGMGIMVCIPFVTLIFKAPLLMFITALIGIVTMLASALMYVAILPEEYDASFKKALPILQEGYVSSEYMPAARQVLRAAALTYLAGALADIVRLWRWLRVIR